MCTLKEHIEQHIMHVVYNRASKREVKALHDVKNVLTVLSLKEYIEGMKK